MRQIDVPLHIENLRTLAERFYTFGAQLLVDQRPLTGTEGLVRLAQRITESHDLVSASITQLTELDGSQVTQFNGAVSALNGVGSVIERASQVSLTLAKALASNAYDAHTWDPQPTDNTADRTLRHDDARRLIYACFKDAAHDMGICADTLRYVATYLADQAPAPDPHMGKGAEQGPPQRLSTLHYAALTVLAKGGTRMYDRARLDRPRVKTADGTRVHVSTVASFAKRGLINVDTSTRPHEGQTVTVTAEGHRALDHHQPAPAAAAAPSVSRVRRGEGYRPLDQQPDTAALPPAPAAASASRARR